MENESQEIKESLLSESGLLIPQNDSPSQVRNTSSSGNFFTEVVENIRIAWNRSYFNERATVRELLINLCIALLNFPLTLILIGCLCLTFWLVMLSFPAFYSKETCDYSSPDGLYRCHEYSIGERTLQIISVVFLVLCQIPLFIGGLCGMTYNENGNFLIKLVGSFFNLFVRRPYLLAQNAYDSYKNYRRNLEDECYAEMAIDHNAQHRNRKNYKRLCFTNPKFYLEMALEFTFYGLEMSIIWAKERDGCENFNLITLSGLKVCSFLMQALNDIYTHRSLKHLPFFALLPTIFNMVSTSLLLANLGLISHHGNSDEICERVESINNSAVFVNLLASLFYFWSIFIVDKEKFSLWLSDRNNQESNIVDDPSASLLAVDNNESNSQPEIIRHRTRQ